MDDYSYEDVFYGETKVFEVKDLKELAGRLEKFVKKNEFDFKIIDEFFSWALLPYYTPYLPGDFYRLSQNAGHIIYRLSDFLTEEERQKIAIYPSEKGSMIIKMLSGNVQWDSLEDWRKSWEKEHPIIPNFIKKLHSAFKFLE